ncbi:MAG: hypothetical protein ACTHMC_21545 [Pseudobacter sp.]|uniref:hypothetical protein n=1 Tax=Pseudobacter sp. TaxID=2045420 RepID=UPI003F7F91E1
MELDSLKDIWKDQDKGMDRYPESNNEILSMLGKKSKSPVAKIRRNLLWELVSIVVVYAVFVAYYAFSKNGQFWEIAVLLGMVGVGFVFYYYHKDKLLKSMQRVDAEVKSNLQTQLHTLEKYVRFYFLAGTLLTPILYYITGLVTLYKKTPHHYSNEALGTRVQPMLNAVQDHQYFTEFMVGGAVVTVLIYFANKWYINKLYGQHINHLKDLLKQMDEI